mgnify:CR=1 FL=1
MKNSVVNTLKSGAAPLVLGTALLAGPAAGLTVLSGVESGLPLCHAYLQPPNPPVDG